MNSLLDNFLKYSNGDSPSSVNDTLTWTLKNVSRSGNEFTKITPGLNGEWDAMACSKESYETGYFTARPGTLNKYCMFGLTEKSVNPNVRDISYGWVLRGDNTIATTLLGDNQIPVTIGDNQDPVIYKLTTALSATYDETSVNFFMDGDVIRTVQRTNTNPLYFAMVFFHKDASVKDVDFDAINYSLKFLNDGTNLINRDKYESNYSSLERSTNIEEETLNAENSNFKGADVGRQKIMKEIDEKLLKIETLEYNKERLKKYVVDGASAYKFEINKVWVYTIFNVGGCAAMIYMLL